MTFAETIRAQPEHGVTMSNTQMPARTARPAAAELAPAGAIGARLLSPGRLRHHHQSTLPPLFRARWSDKHSGPVPTFVIGMVI